MKKENKISKLKAIFVQWSQASTFNCFPKIFQTKNINAKILWSFIFILFSSLTFSLLIKAILDYLEFDVITKIRMISPKSIPFPTLTICDANPFTTQEAEILIRNLVEIENLTFSNENIIYTANEYGRIEMNTLIDLTLKSIAHMNESTKKSMGFALNQIETCRFDFKPCEFEWFFSYKYGNCFQFNNRQDKETTMGGRTFGLFLSFGPLINKNNFNTYYSKGLKIFIHNGTFNLTGAEEINIKMGEQTSIKLKKTFTRQAARPHSACQDLTLFKSSIFDRMKHFHGEYRQKNCLEICLQMLIGTECGCMLTILPEFDKHLPCVNASEKYCQNKFFLDKKTMYEKCIDKCPLECEYTTYDWSMSTMDYPSVPFFNSLKKNSKLYSNFSFNEFKNSHSIVHVFFESVEYTHIVETPKTSFVDLIANLGGVLGIFLGFSLFSLVEFVELVCRVILLLLGGKNNQKQISNPN